jgi:hypothetical protein
VDRFNRLIIWLAVPIGLLAGAMFFTLLMSWVWETGLCGTWLARVLPSEYCSPMPLRG